jgi:hypothetical protein
MLHAPSFSYPLILSPNNTFVTRRGAHNWSWLTITAVVVLFLTLAALALVWVRAPVTPGPTGGGARHHSGAWRHGGHRRAVIAVPWAVGASVQVQLLGQVPTGPIPRRPWWCVLLLTTGRHCSRPRWSTSTLHAATHLILDTHLIYGQNTKWVPMITVRTTQNIVDWSFEGVLKSKVTACPMSERFWTTYHIVPTSCQIIFIPSDPWRSVTEGQILKHLQLCGKVMCTKVF